MASAVILCNSCKVKTPVSSIISFGFFQPWSSPCVFGNQDPLSLKIATFFFFLELLLILFLIWNAYGKIKRIILFCYFKNILFGFFQTDLDIYNQKMHLEFSYQYIFFFIVLVHQSYQISFDPSFLQFLMAEEQRITSS